MPTYNVQNNPYYEQWRGRNLITDLLANATQSLSAPASGPYGEKKGFFRSLIGDQTNRMNSAAAMREQDVAAGKAPFEAEVAQESKINDTNNKDAAERQAAGNAARMQVAQFEQEQENKRTAATQLSRERQANINAQWENEFQTGRDRAKALLDDARMENALRKQKMLRETPTPMQQYQMSRPQQLGEMAYFPKTGEMRRTSSPGRYAQQPEGGSGEEILASPNELNWINNGDAEENVPPPQALNPADIDALFNANTNRRAPSLNY